MIGPANFRMADGMAFEDAIRTLVEDRHDLSRRQAREVIGAMLELRFDSTETVALLVALSQKGETAAEIAGAVDAFNARRPPFSVAPVRALNIGGTGGDRAGTFNISTTAAFVVAAVGVPVVKHGNRGVTSTCGSMDMLSALGIDITKRSNERRIRADLQAYNLAFVATPLYYDVPPLLTETRRKIRARSILNLAGALLHPAGLRLQVIGVALPSLMAPMANALALLGNVTAFIVHGVGGLDEVSCVGETLISSVRDGIVQTFKVQPSDFDAQPCELHQLRGGDSERNAQICRNVLHGQAGPFREATVVVASTALVLAGHTASFKEAAATCRQAIDCGQSMHTLEMFMKEMK